MKYKVEYIQFSSLADMSIIGRKTTSDFPGRLFLDSAASMDPCQPGLSCLNDQDASQSKSRFVVLSSENKGSNFRNLILDVVH